MTDEQPNNPLHGVTLEAMLEQLVAHHGWPELSQRIKIRCFQQDPSVKSSLKFLRKTEWALSRVEQLYLDDLRLAERNKERNRRRAARRARAANEDASELTAAEEVGELTTPEEAGEPQET